MTKELCALHREILRVLIAENTSYASPLTSAEIGRKLNIAPSYIRKRLGGLVAANIVGVRRGSGGGYYLSQEDGHATSR